MKTDFVIDKTLNISLIDLGRKGCVAYVFNEKARARVDEFLRFVKGPCFTQDKIEDAIKQKLSVSVWSQYQGEAVASPRSILEIAAAYPEKYRHWRANMDRAVAGVYI